MTEQELREKFENNKELFPNHPMDEGEVIKRKLFTKNEFGNYSWNDIRRDFKSFNEGYSLAQETIAELESRLEQSVDISVVNELNETIKAKDAEIERLLEQQAKDSYKERAGVFDDIIEKKDKSIAEARGMTNEYISVISDFLNLSNRKISPNDARILLSQYAELAKKKPIGLNESSPETYKKLRSMIEKLKALILYTDPVMEHYECGTHVQLKQWEEYIRCFPSEAK